MMTQATTAKLQYFSQQQFKFTFYNIYYLVLVQPLEFM